MQTIRSGIFDNGEVRDLIGDLDRIPDNIAQARMAVVEAEHALKFFIGLKDAQDAKAVAETECIYEASQSVDKDGKKVNTNDSQRKMAALSLIKTSPEYHTACQAFTEARSEQARLSMAVGTATAVYRGLEAEFHALIAQANMVSGLCHESTLEGSSTFVLEQHINGSK